MHAHFFACKLSSHSHFDISSLSFINLNSLSLSHFEKPQRNQILLFKNNNLKVGIFLALSTVTRQNVSDKEHCYEQHT